MVVALLCLRRSRVPRDTGAKASLAFLGGVDARAGQAVAPGVLILNVLVFEPEAAAPAPAARLDRPIQADSGSLGETVDTVTSAVNFQLLFRKS